MLKYKIDVKQALKDKGYTTYSLRQKKIMGESTIQKFRTGEMVSYEVLNQLCQMLSCQPGDLLMYVPDQTNLDDSDQRKA